MKLMPLDPAKKPLSLAPGKTLEIRVADYIDQIQALVDISRRFIYFEDGMRWDVGAYALPLASHPG
jgi:hypothetical protein